MYMVREWPKVSMLHVKTNISYVIPMIVFLFYEVLQLFYEKL